MTTFEQRPSVNTSWNEALEHQLETLPAGVRVCHIYSAPEERLKVACSFFRGAVACHERCLYFGNKTDAEQILEALYGPGDSSREVVPAGAWLAVTERTKYVQNGHFDPPALLAMIEEELGRARALGFAGLRVAGEMNWVLGPDIDSARYIEYQTLLRLAPRDWSALSQYDGRQTRPTLIRDVLRSSPTVLINERLHDNVFCEPPAVLLGQGDVERARAEWMVKRIQSHTRRVSALSDLARLALERGTPDELFAPAASMVAAELQLDDATIIELLPSGDSIRLLATTAPDKGAIGSVMKLASDHSLVTGRLRLGQPLIISNWQSETSFRQPERLRANHITSTASVAFERGSVHAIAGVLSAHTRRPQIFSDDEILYLATVGRILGVAIAVADTRVGFRELVENAPDLVVQLDESLRIMYVNPAVERSTGIAAGVLVHQTSGALGIPESVMPGWELVLRHVWRTARDQSFDLTLNTPVGERVFETRVVAEPGAYGSVRSLLMIARDITDRRRSDIERMDLYRKLIDEQRRVQELIERLGVEQERTFERTLAVSSEVEQLTERERYVLKLVAVGRTNREIAAEISVSSGTIKNLMTRILSKLNVADRTQAAVRAAELGLLRESEEKQ